MILDLACKSGESQDRAFYHDPLFVSHAQHLQTVQAGLPLGFWRAVQLGGRKVPQVAIESDAAAHYTSIF